MNTRLMAKQMLAWQFLGMVGEEREQIGNVTAVKDDGHQERVSYQCKTCNRSFSRADNMKTHMLTKHLESAVFFCNACVKMFKKSEGLEKTFGE